MGRKGGVNKSKPIKVTYVRVPYYSITVAGEGLHINGLLKEKSFEEAKQVLRNLWNAHDSPELGTITNQDLEQVFRHRKK